MGFEAKIIMYLQSFANSGLTTFFETVSALGSWAGFLCVIGIIITISKTYGTMFTYGYLSGVGINFVLKNIINRPRPYISYDQIIALSSAASSSLPSGHAVSSILIAFFVSYFVCSLSGSKLLKFFTVSFMTMFVILVCISRMYLGLHYLTDILAGLVLGAVVGIISLTIFRRKFIKRGF